MRHIVFAILALISSAAYAQTPSIDELKDANDKCSHHRLPEPNAARGAAHREWMQHGYEDGWDHCGAINNAYTQAQQAKDDADETKNPDLKSTRDLARRISP